jgi:hypothetical protein
MFHNDLFVPGGGLPGLLSINVIPRENFTLENRPRTAALGDARGGSRKGFPPIYTQMRIARSPGGVFSIFRGLLKAYRLVR